jgi:hypothetical protein
MKFVGQITQNHVNRFPSYAGILTTVMTAVTFVFAFLAVPRSGPLCNNSCFSYPYAESISRFPADYIWMYLALAWLIIYTVLVVCIHRYADSPRKIFSQIGLSFALMSALILLADYFIQISVVQPSLLHGELNGIALISQYNPHGIFIALEELGYTLMSIAFLFMAPVFFKNKLEKAVRSIFMANFVLTFLSFIIFSVLYGINREYRFEIAVIAINWLTLIPSGILLSIIFKMKSQDA